ncbi:MAG TPA: hypothetical protein EYN66_17185 [Myxococcales bacterium]|nr:hypothetical protein [Myxococcales bacterium]
MHPDLKNLLRLAESDIEISRCQQATAAVHAGIKGAVLATQKAQAAVDAASEGLHALGIELVQLRDKAVLYARQKNGAERALNAGVGDAAAAIRQMERCDQLIDQNETDQLCSLDREEDEQARLAQLTVQLAKAKAGHLTLREAKPEALKKISEALSKANRSRKASTGGLPGHMLKKYDGLKARRGVAVALFVDGACKTCHTVPPHRIALDIKNDRVETCGRCGRWLVPA